ncbi:MAG: hypothetical protein ACXV74_14875 [Methylobacter sp.]
MSQEPMDDFNNLHNPELYRNYLQIFISMSETWKIRARIGFGSEDAIRTELYCS